MTEIKLIKREFKPTLKTWKERTFKQKLQFWKSFYKYDVNEIRSMKKFQIIIDEFDNMPKAFNFYKGYDD